MPTVYEGMEKMLLKRYHSEVGNVSVSLFKIFQDEVPLNYAVEYQVGDDPLSPHFVRKSELFNVKGLEDYKKAHDLFAAYVRAVL